MVVDAFQTQTACVACHKSEPVQLRLPKDNESNKFREVQTK